MKGFLSIFLFIVFLIRSVSFSYADSGKEEERLREIEKALFMASSTQDRTLKIGLVDCVLYALKQNSEILIKKIDPKIKQDDVRAANAEFEPSFDIDASLRDNTELSYSALQGAQTANSKDLNLDAQVSGKLITGTEYSIDLYNQRYKSDSSFQTINPYYAVTPKITITQPLFRGFGIIVNTADVLIAKNNKAESDCDFKQEVIDTVTKTKNYYYNYVYSLEKLDIDRLSLERTQDLLEINKARYSKGLISSVDLLETEASVAQREKNVLASEAQFKKGEDDLKYITNLIDDPELWNAKIELIDKPEFKIEKVELLICLQAAFKFRPDYQSGVIDLKNRDIKIKVAKNALLPTVDLTASFGLNGLGKDYQDALDKVDTDYKDWGVGLKVNIPWGGAERAQYDQRKLEKAQAILTLKRLEQNIMLDVRDKVREVKVQQRQVEVSKVALEKEKENYIAQKERYRAGQVSTHDMLDYEDKLSQAELDYLKALIDYNIALVNLDKSQGLTLVKNNIKLEE